MNKEIWKDIKGYEGLYQISTKGRIKSLNYNHTQKCKIRKIDECSNKGYSSILLCNKFGKKKYTIHRLVAETFIPNLENKPQVNHKNGIKTDNRVENLEWATNGENEKHAYKNGLKQKKFGINNAMSKSVLQYSLDGKLIQEFQTINNASIELGISSSTIINCSKGRVKRPTKFIFKYKEEIV